MVSPPVSPSVVAAILMIQKASVTSGTLLKLDSGDCCGMRGLAPFVAGVTRRYEWGIVPPACSTIIEGCAIEETNAGIRSGALNSASVCWPPRSEPASLRDQACRDECAAL